MARSKLSDFGIIYFGLLSSTLALGVVTFVNLLGFNVMGFYIWFIVPIGAILVGVVAGLGYAVGLRVLNVKLRPSFLLAILALSLTTYIGSHFITYLFYLAATGQSFVQFSFWDYIRLICETTAYRSLRGGGQPITLGFWGYPLHLLELIGFSLGTLGPALFQGSRPYCDDCERYMRKEVTTYLAAPLSIKDWKAVRGKSEKQRELDQVIADVQARFTRFWEQIQPLHRERLEELLENMPDVKPKESVAYVQNDFYFCNTCDAWHLQANLNHQGMDGQLQTKLIHDGKPLVADQPVPPLPPGDSTAIREQKPPLGSR